MDASGFGSVLLIGFASWAGTRQKNVFLGVLISLIILLVAVHLVMRPENLFQRTSVQPHVDDTLGIRIAIKKLAREGDTTTAEYLKKFLLDDKKRRLYLAHGDRAFIQLKNETDTAEFVIKLLGPSLLWYIQGLLLVLIANYSTRGRGILGWGLLLLSLVGVIEFAEKNFEKLIAFKALPFDMPYDSVELIRVLAAAAFALVTYLYSLATEDKRLDAVKTAERVVKLNDILIKRE